MREMIFENINEKLKWCGSSKSIEEHFSTNRFKIVKVAYRQYIPEGEIDFNKLSDNQLLYIFEIILKQFYTQM